MAYVVEMAGYDKVAAAMKTVRFAMGEGIAFTDSYAPGALMRWSSASQRIAVNASGVVSLTGDKGEVMIANFPDTIWDQGPWDAMADWVWQNQTVVLYEVEGTNWAVKTELARGVLEQPVATLEAGGSLGSVLRFPLRDPRSGYETPLQPSKFLGTNIGPAGVEGGPELKGKPKPIVYGLVSNISPPKVNSSLLIYQIADKSVAVLCVRDGGIPITRGTVRVSLATLQANSPPSGKYDIFTSATGTFIRLGTTPIFNLTVDADEATTEANQSHANIWSRIRTARMGSVVNAASVTALNLVDPGGAGFYWADDMSQIDALSEVLSSFSGYEEQMADGTWAVSKLVLPVGEPVVEIVQVSPVVLMKTKSRAMQKLTRVRPDYAPDGAPPFRVSLQWGRNYTVMEENAFAGAAAARLKEKFATEFRTVTATDLAIWNPDLKTGIWKNAPELTVITGYQPGPDGLISPAAQAEADRIMALLGPVRGQYQVEYVPETGDTVRPGQVVRMIYPRMGMVAGPLFRVLEAGFNVEGQQKRAVLVVGLQA